MPKRIGFLYDKMVDKKFIRKVILDSARYRHSRRDVSRVLNDLDGYVDRAYEMLRDGTYIPSQPKEKRIYDESSQKYREIEMVPYWPDGVMQWLLVAVMKPVLMRGMYKYSCASIPGRGTRKVHDRIQTAMRHDAKGTKYAAELDVRHYYPHISIQKLMHMLRRKIKDERLLRMVLDILLTCRKGLAIGYYICQWLANYYLEALDRDVISMPGVKYVTRHMDNYTLLGPNKRLLHRAVKSISIKMQSLGLTLKKNWQVYRTCFKQATIRRHEALTERQKRIRKPRMVSAAGYRFSRTQTILRRRNFLRLARQCRRVKKKQSAGNPVSARLAGSILSRIGQLKHCDSQHVRICYVYPINIKNLKGVIRNESKRKRDAECPVLCRATA